MRMNGHAIQLATLFALTMTVVGCDDKAKCMEACGKAHHESVGNCDKLKGKAKTTCETGVDETHEECEASCKKK
jgi:hypothetical protein